MDNWVIVMMLSVSIFLGSLGLFAFMWAIKNGQFEITVLTFVTH